jgi:cytochrome c oxidase subunit 3
MVDAIERTHLEEPYDPVGARFGMWLFIFSELILFGGLFVLYTSYAYMYNSQFLAGSHQLSRTIGTANTVILLTSSLTMVLSIAAIRRADKRRATWLLSATILMAVVFLVNKGFEWGHKFEHHLYPGSPELLKLEKGSVVFYNLYYAMTGLHAFHVIVGIALLAFCLRQLGRDRVTRERYILLENCGLYWHMVDAIWIFLFPLFYLIS